METYVFAAVLCAAAFHATWNALIKIGLDHPDIVFEIVYGISDATGRDYDNSRAYALGYQPQDRFEPWLDQVLADDPQPAPETDPALSAAEITLGGHFSATEFIGSPQRLKSVGL